MTLRPVAVLMLAGSFAVAGCGGSKTEADNRNAAGEVLPGSASDAMLPVDTVRSHPPLAPPGAVSKGDRVGKAKASTAATAEPTAPASADVPAPAPVATPSAE